MKSIITYVFFLFILASLPNFAQTVLGMRQIESKSNQKTFFKNYGDIFGCRVFIENKGQYTLPINSSQHVEYVLDDGFEKIFFTRSGIIYELKEEESFDEEEFERNEKGGMKSSPSKYVTMIWINSNRTNLEIIPDQKQNHYITFGDIQYNASCYKKLLYKNIYSNIDLEYIIPFDKKIGIKYSFILHPGANVNDIKILYAGDVKKISKHKNGNLTIKSNYQSITEHKPFSYYNKGKKLESEFSINKDTIGFKFPTSYDRSQTVIIDPWVSSSVSLTNNNLAYDVDYDIGGNVLIYGGKNMAKVAYYSASGILLWTFGGSIISPSWNSQTTGHLGNFAVDKFSGKTYIGQGVNQSTTGARVVRLNSAGNYDNFITGPNSLNQEIWDMGFRCQGGDLFVMGGGHTSNNSAATINTLTGSMSLSTFQPSNLSFVHDIASHAIDDLGNIFVYYSCSNNALNNNICCVNSSFNGNIWTSPSGFSTLSEASNKSAYASGGAGPSTGFNCLAVNNNYLYFYDGYNIAAYSKTTGSLIANSTNSLSAKAQGGIAVDECNKLYLGGNGSILTFSFNGSNFIPLGAINLSLTGVFQNVFDLKLNKATQTIFVCGSGFVGTYPALGSSPCVSSIGPCSYNQISLVVLPTVATCSALGSATASAFGGIGPYTYTWMPSNQTGSIASGLSAGSYTVILHDSTLNLNFFAITNISSLNTLNASISPNSFTVCAGDTIMLNSIVSGGTPPYYNVWSPASFITPNFTYQKFVQNTGGIYTYTLTVTDINNCITSKYATITFLPKPQISINSPSVCPNNSVILTASGAISYTWQGNVISNSLVVSPFVTTSYSLVGKNATCANTSSTLVHVYPPINPSILVGGATCLGKTIQLNAAGGTSYLWSGPGGFTSTFPSPAFSSLSFSNAGVYQVTVTSNFNCTAITSVNIVAYTIPTVAATGCTVCSNGIFSLAGISSMATDFFWTGPLGFSSNLQNPIFVNPNIGQAGAYTLNVFSAGGCSNSAMAQVSVTQKPNVSATSNGPQCEGKNINFTGSGGDTFFWTGPGSFASTLQNPQLSLASATCSGIYTLISTKGPCVDTIMHSLTVYPLPTVALSYNDPVCEATTLKLFASSNCFLQTYLWTSPLYSSTSPNPERTNAQLSNSGIYKLYIVDNNSCNSTSTIAITIQPKPNVTASGSTVCLNAPAMLSAFGASTYVWTGPTTFYSTAAFPLINYMSTAFVGTYTVIGTAANTCTGSSNASVSMWSLPEASISIISKPVVCMNETVLLNGNGGLKYDWYGPFNKHYEGQQINFIAGPNNPPGTYSLFVTDENGCSAMATKHIIINELPYGLLVGNKMEGCAPLCSDFVFYNIQDSAKNTSISWQIDGDSKTGNKFSHCFYKEGKTKIQAFLYNSINTCSNVIDYYVNVNQSPIADFIFEPAQPIENIDDVLFTNTSLGESQTSWHWYFIENPGIYSKNLSASHVFEVPGSYPVALVVENAWGCVDTITKVVNVAEDFSIYVPNVFTPNDDLLNETFITKGRGIKSYHMRIYNRWGIKIFESNNQSIGWDAHYEGKPCQNDVYTWKMEVASFGGKEKVLTGHVSLLR